MRFDDRLSTVLGADMSTVFGARAAFRQLVDLVVRGRVPADAIVLDRLERLRANVDVATRASSARQFALATPPVALVRFFARDDHSVAAATLRVVRLEADEWVALIAEIGPAGRAILRDREDLPDAADRALASFGKTDFSLPNGVPPEILEFDAETAPILENTAPVAPSMQPVSPTVALTSALEVAPVEEASGDDGFVSQPLGSSKFEISALVDRIQSFQRDREAGRASPSTTDRPSLSTFRFETDFDGVIRVTDADVRGAVVGLTLASAAPGATIGADAVASAALRRRARFDDARLTIGGMSDLSGEWRISGTPMFDRRSGRFLGMQGRARRPRREEAAVRSIAPASDGMRRLVHELRTPTNAIAGFSELIESELFGPVAPPYRERAGAIHRDAIDLALAIEDVELAARLDGRGLDLHREPVPLEPIVSAELDALAPFIRLRGCTLVRTQPLASVVAYADTTAVRRLITRLIALAIGAAKPDETIRISLDMSAKSAAIAVTRPCAWAGLDETALRVADQSGEDMSPSSLLGRDFAMRLIARLAGEIGGSFAVTDTDLTLAMPAASTTTMERASTN